MNTKFIFKLFVLLTCVISQSYAQTPLANTTSDIVLIGGPTVPGEGGGVAYNPIMNVYYANVPGVTTNPFETFSSTGTLVSSVVGTIDTRGAWWNPLLNQVEMNTFNGQGVYSINLNPLNGYALSTTTAIQSPTNVQPNIQSLGQYDWINNHFVYYNAGSIIRVNRATNTIVSTNVVTGLPATTVTAFAVGVLNVPNYELALYDYVNRRVYFINGTTYAHTYTTQLPLATPGNQSSFNVGWANKRIFLCNTAVRSWTGYPLFCGSIDTVDVEICSGQSYNFNGKQYNTAGNYYDTFKIDGCDSIVMTSLVVKPVYTVNVTDSIYEGEIYNFYGNNYYSTGNYVSVHTAQNGCDSSIILSLKVIPVVRHFVDTVICEYDFYELYSRKYNKAGFQRDTFIFDDRHEILTLNLTIRKRPNVGISILGRDMNDLCIGEPVTFVATGAETYEWLKIDQPLNNLYFKGTRLEGWVYDSLTHLMIRGFDDLGCYNEYFYDLKGKNCCQLFIPNAFTPNGDGLNDVFQVKGMQPKTYRIMIFNRLGTLVFNAESVDATWSGLNTNGTELATDVYYYHITGECFDGTTINEKGDITLLR